MALSPAGCKTTSADTAEEIGRAEILGKKNKLPK